MFVQLEWLVDGSWQTTHAGIEMKNPDAYVQGVCANTGRRWRATDVETGEQFVSLTDPCPDCGGRDHTQISECLLC